MPPVIIGSEPKTHQQLLEEQRQFQLDMHRDAQAAENRRNVGRMAAVLLADSRAPDAKIRLTASGAVSQALAIADEVDRQCEERIEAAKKEAGT